MRKLFFVLGMALLLASCSEAEVVEHVEAFTIETMSDTPDSSGLYVKVGYHRVNSVSFLKEWGDKVQGETSSIEDFYNLDGDYVSTRVTYSYGEALKRHNLLDGKNEYIELTEPTTILAPAMSSGVIETKSLSEEEKEKVKAHVLKYVDGIR
ncbi:membrane lipoprotein lipid attachment site-containing protein [Sporosarcina sp. NPDC096371]|uniref:membrane lipoprotein lipid attachment site-containing protein n=1 Tax=Sporosarcina sp. NPDC096371 TaxID=3364530 RepID=UPI0038109BDC